MLKVVVYLVFGVLGFLLIFVNYKTLNENKRKSINNINNIILVYLNKNKFEITKTFSLKHFKSIYDITDINDKKIFIDSKNKKICLIDYDNLKGRIVEIDKFLSCDIYENNSNNSCVELKLIFTIDNLEKPMISYSIVPFGKSVDKTGVDYKIYIEKMQEVKAYFDVIKSDMTKSEKNLKKKRFVYCKYCGAKNNEESLKCESCGGNLE